MTLESVVDILARQPEFNQAQVLLLCMVLERSGMKIMTYGEINEMKSRMDVCPGHPISEFVRS